MDHLYANQSMALPRGAPKQIIVTHEIKPSTPLEFCTIIALQSIGLTI